MAVTQHSNKCYTRVYVNDMKGNTTLTVNGKQIVNGDYMGADTIRITDIGVKDTDAFDNEFYHIDRYNKTNVDNVDTVQGTYVGRDHITAKPCAECTNPGGTPIPDPTTVFCTIFRQTIIGTSVLKNDIDSNWVRRDKDCKLPTARQLDNGIPVPKSNLPLYHVARKVDNDFYINDTCAKRSPFSILVPVDAGGLIFTYMNGDLILTVEGDQVTSAPNTTILVEEEGNV